MLSRWIWVGALGVIFLSPISVFQFSKMTSHFFHHRKKGTALATFSPRLWLAHSGHDHTELRLPTRPVPTGVPRVGRKKVQVPYARPAGGCPVPPCAWSHSSRAGICKVLVHCAFLCVAGGSRHWSRWRYTYHSGKLLPASIWTVWNGTLRWGQLALLWKQIERKDGNFYWWSAHTLSLE